MLPTHRISHFLGAVALGLSAAFVLPPAHADERPGKKQGAGLALTYCEFRAKLDTDSAANWTVIPAQTGHAFRGKLDS